MNTTTTSAQPGIIIWPGCEAERTTREQACNVLLVCRFLREPVTCRFNGATHSSMDGPRTTALTEEQARIACKLLCHGTKCILEAFMPKTKMEVVTPLDTPMIEIGEGWTMAPTIEIARGYRGAIHWHAYDPEGDPLVEHTTEAQAAEVLMAAIAANHIRTNWRKTA